MDYRKLIEEDESYLNALMYAKLAKLTPRIKKELFKIGSNQYVIPKVAEHVVWRIVSKTDDDGREAYYLARINNGNDPATKKTAADNMPFAEDFDKQQKMDAQEYNKPYSEVLIDKFEVTQGTVNLVPTNCPGKGKDQALLIGDAGKPYCILQGKMCPHLQDFAVTVLAGDKTVNCGIK